MRHEAVTYKSRSLPTLISRRRTHALMLYHVKALMQKPYIYKTAKSPIELLFVIQRSAELHIKALTLLAGLVLAGRLTGESCAGY